MVNTLLNNKPFHPQQNIFTHQSKPAENQNRKTARAGESRNVLQDKEHLGNAPHKASQPAPFSNGPGARALNTKTTQIHKTKSGREKRIHSTFHLEAIRKVNLTVKSYQRRRFRHPTEQQGC